MAVSKVTLVDIPEKMRPQKSPSMECSILMGRNHQRPIIKQTTKKTAHPTLGGQVNAPLNYTVRRSALSRLCCLLGFKNFRLG
jgi:hypothetical protein